MSKIKMPIWKKVKKTKDGKSFNSYYSKAFFLDETGTKVLKQVEVKFNKEVHVPSISFGFLHVEETELSIPSKYIIKTEIENGKEKKVYPCIFVDDANPNFEELKVKVEQSRFDIEGFGKSGLEEESSLELEEDEESTEI